MKNKRDSNELKGLELKIIKENQRKSKFLKVGSGESLQIERNFGLNRINKGIVNQTMNDLPQAGFRRIKLRGKTRKESFGTEEDLI